MLANTEDDVVVEVMLIAFSVVSPGEGIDKNEKTWPEVSPVATVRVVVVDPLVICS